MLKRLFDFFVATLGLLLAAPVMLALAVLIRVKLGAPILFRQVRPGLGTRPFAVYKFRTMRDALGSNGLPLADDLRLSRFGATLRKFSLDELPQLINVLRGDMSLVGPRPLLMEYLPLYSAEQARRHDVLPGITGWAQVNGRNALSWDEKFALDVWYVDHRSFVLDMKIIWLTLLKVMRPQGVSQTGHATMPKFTGSTRHDD